MDLNYKLTCFKNFNQRPFINHDYMMMHCSYLIFSNYLVSYYNIVTNVNCLDKRTSFKLPTINTFLCFSWKKYLIISLRDALTRFGVLPPFAVQKKGFCTAE